MPPPRSPMSTEFPSRVAANDAEALAQLAPEDRYTNRELSWLSFNRRVLAESENERYPLLERLRFLSISASNLDEFTMVRIAGLEGQVQRGIETLGIDGSSPRQQLAAIREQLLALEDRQQASLETLRDLLSQEGILLASIDDLSKDCKNWLARYFESDILPLITPQAIDPSHPFPFVANRGIGVIFRLKRGKRQADLIEMVLIPSGAPRFVRVPGEKAIYVAIEQLVTRFADQLFPGFKVLGDGIFRVLRDSDIEVEEEAEDLVRYFRTAIQRRRRGRTVLLELDDDCDEVSEALLRDQLDVEEAMIVKTNGMLGLADLATICGEPRPDLKFEPFSPRYPERILEHDGDCFAAIREKDIVIHHPFESFDVVVDFLHQAAVDPAVVRGVVGKPHRAHRFRGNGQGLQGAVVQAGLAPGKDHPSGVADTAYPLFQVGRHHPFQLRLHAGNGRRSIRQPKLSGGQQPEGDRQGFLVGKHHRRQLETGHQSVSTIAPLLGHHGNAQLFEHCDVASDGSPIHAQPLRQFGTADLDAATRAQLARGQLATEMLKQPHSNPLSLEQEVIILFAVNEGLLEDIPLERCGDFQDQLLRHMSSTHPQIGQDIATAKDITPEIESALTQAINDFKGGFSA